MYKEFIPKLFFCIQSNYTFAAFRKDLIAGISVGIIALPLAMAFAMASGVTPIQGLITAIIAGFCISALGGSRVQIGGPTGAFVVLVYDIVQRNGYEGLAASTLIGAFLLIILGVFRIGSWIKYIPHSLITGFTTGLAVLIFSSQIKDFLGLNITQLPCQFLHKWSLYFIHLSSCQLSTLSIGLGTLLLIVVIRKYAPKIPWAVTSIFFATLIVYFFKIPVETIFSKFGEIPSRLPLPSIPKLSILHGSIQEIFLDGVAIALLGGIESLLSAVIGDGMIGGRHRSNCELIGQGIANFFSVIFGGIPATGAVARTAMNVKSGALTPIAGIIHAFTLLLIVLFLAPIISYIPLPALSAVLIVVAWNMSEMSHFISLFRAPKEDVLILCTAFFLTILVDITIAICFGMVLACLLFMKRMSTLSKVVSLKQTFQEEEKESALPASIPSQVEIYEIQGPFFFGTADILQDILHGIEKNPKVFIIRMKHVSFIDASSIHSLQEFHHRCKKMQIQLFLSELQEKAKKDLQKIGFIHFLGKDHLFVSLQEALVAANNFLAVLP